MGSYSDLLVEEGKNGRGEGWKGEELGRVEEFIPSILILTFNFGRNRVFWRQVASSCVESSEDGWADESEDGWEDELRALRASRHP